jgi:hypothetical protein
MPHGFLIVQVFADNEAQPLNGARIHITGENTDINETTDISGKTREIPLNAPSREFSLTPQSNVQPYSEYNLSVSMPGLESAIIEGVQIFDGETSIQKVFLNSIEGSLQKTDISDIDPHVLWGDYPPKIDETNNNNELRVLPEVIIPEYIIVHDGIPTNSNAKNYIVSFPDYIKNVASSEIYSTWPKETIKANVMAIISFALNRIFTEWYTSRGYNFTITSSTAYDQKYSHNRTIFKSISDVVDEIFNQYIRRGNQKQPFLAQYNDGIKVNNKGWLSQWGSKELGDQGYDALSILRYYYSPDITPDTAEIIEGLPQSFPGYNLQMGSCGQPVQKIQNEINKINGSYPGIPKIIPADGVFDERTRNSVRIFQQVFGLPVTGVVNFATWYRISYIFAAVSKMLQGIYA